MRPELAKIVQKVTEKDWQTFGKEDDGTLRQWAEVVFVPSEVSEKKDSKPLRYVGLRLLKPQGVLFADGSDRHHYAVVRATIRIPHCGAWIGRGITPQCFIAVRASRNVAERPG